MWFEETPDHTKPSTAATVGVKKQKQRNKSDGVTVIGRKETGVDKPSGPIGFGSDKDRVSSTVYI